MRLVSQLYGNWMQQGHEAPRSTVYLVHHNFIQGVPPIGTLRASFSDSTPPHPPTPKKIIKLCGTDVHLCCKNWGLLCRLLVSKRTKMVKLVLYKILCILSVSLGVLLGCTLVELVVLTFSVSPRSCYII